ncbi:uncharacterized protein [Symphalangus syndactylus]|uniref:uncharacterized protein n=1 Tax=Symphalangus syndactylus TaxID=9590 RepID=UPI0024414589|nr:uncharacterized protein LOC129462911 [Symphalangus syndactylus]
MPDAEQAGRFGWRRRDSGGNENARWSRPRLYKSWVPGAPAPRPRALAAARTRPWGLPSIGRRTSRLVFAALGLDTHTRPGPGFGNASEGSLAFARDWPRTSRSLPGSAPPDWPRDARTLRVPSSNVAVGRSSRSRGGAAAAPPKPLVLHSDWTAYPTGTPPRTRAGSWGDAISGARVKRAAAALEGGVGHLGAAVGSVCDSRPGPTRSARSRETPTEAWRQGLGTGIVRTGRGTLGGDESTGRGLGEWGWRDGREGQELGAWDLPAPKPQEDAAHAWSGRRKDAMVGLGDLAAVTQLWKYPGRWALLHSEGSSWVYLPTRPATEAPEHLKCGQSTRDGLCLPSPFLLTFLRWESAPPLILKLKLVRQNGGTPTLNVYTLTAIAS